MLNLSQSKEMKKLSITIITILLFSALLIAHEVNQPAEKVQSVGTKSLSANGIITAFTFLLTALTIMATLFGIFIGYMGYKSSKEYEKEVARAEKAAERAEEAAKEAEAIIREIRQKGYEVITDIQAKFNKTAEEIGHKIESEKGGLPEKKNKLLQLIDKIIDMFKDKNYEGAINLTEALLLFDENNGNIWHLFALVLSGSKKFKEALEKIAIAINKDPNNGVFYESRSFIKLGWWRAFKGPKPSKSEIIKDISKAIELGSIPDNTTREDISCFLDDSEYKKLLGKSKEEDGFGKE